MQKNGCFFTLPYIKSLTEIKEEDVSMTHPFYGVYDNPSLISGVKTCLRHSGKTPIYLLFLGCAGWSAP